MLTYRNRCGSILSRNKETKKIQKREGYVHMANFQEQLKAEMERVQQNSGGGDFEKVEYPTQKLKHDQLYFSKNNTEFTVRILPGANGQFFSQEFREIFLNGRNSKGTDISRLFILDKEPKPNESRLESSLLRWQQEARVPNIYNKQAKPDRRFFVNAVQVQMVNGQAVMETDANGDLVVRLLKLPVSAYNAIISKLGDEMLTPQGSDEYSFIGVANAYPIRIQKPAPGQMSYTVDVYSNHELGPLPQGWENQLEDLAYQATPWEEFNKGFVDHFIDVTDGVEGQSDNNEPAQAPNQPQFNQPNQQQQPTQPQQGFGQPAQGNGFGQPAQGNGFGQPAQSNGFGQPAQGNEWGQPAQAPTQPTQNTPTQPTQPTPTQPVEPVPNNTGFGQPAQGGAPQQQATTPPPVGEAASVEDVLAKMQKGVTD